MSDGSEISTFAKKVSFFFLMLILFFTISAFCFYLVSPYHSCVRSLTSARISSSDAHLVCMRQK